MYGSTAADEHIPASDNPGALVSSAAAADDAFAKRGCCSFWVPFEAWERMPPPPNSPTPLSRRWWVSRGLRAFKKVREWSGLVAGPKWKTFIRRFRRNRNGGGGGGSGRFGYDPLSYALNFDEGQDSDSDGDGVRRGFSFRYVAPPVSTKSSMDLGGSNAPPFLQEGH